MKSSLTTLVAAFITASSFTLFGFANTETLNAVDAQEKSGLSSHAHDLENLNIHLYDESRLEAESLNLLKERDKRSHEYLFSAMETLHSGFEELRASLKKLQQISDTSLIGVIPVQEFFAAIRAHNEMVDFLEDRIAGLALLPALQQEAKADLSNKVDFSPLKEHYLQQLKVVQGKVEHLHFRLTLPGDILHEQDGIGTDQLRGVQLLSAETLSQMKRQVLQKRAMSTRERNTIDQSINRFTRKALEGFIDVFGKSERYRTSSDQKGMRDAYIDLKEAFWARFYIRANYGIKIGSIPVNYQKRIFNADYLLSSVSIGVMTAWDENHLVRALNQATEAEATLHDKGAWWLSESIRHFGTKLLGSQPEEAAKQLIIGLIKQDLEQELALGKSGGLRKVRAYYRDYFYTNEKQKAFYKKKESVVFGDEDDDDPEADVAVVEAGTLKGVITQCISVLEQLELRLDEARKLQDSLVLLTKDSHTVTKRKKRTAL
ncbi:hypothetical protein [Parendozoicomonas sp. Alg238-R29]|uniref:hypothetical protein n=1 Tax=Parendozoicomonas sp. Alg238-R29 TaxID=2993446 RepID=UPI00248E6DA7|nr:hypothetical protein [Parendozoicomonas sp. Alg238-R29]